MWGDWSFMEYQDENGLQLTPEKLRVARVQAEAWRKHRSPDVLFRDYMQGEWHTPQQVATPVADDHTRDAQRYLIPIPRADAFTYHDRGAITTTPDHIPCAPASPTPFMGHTLSPAARPKLRLIRGGKP